MTASMLRRSPQSCNSPHRPLCIHLIPRGDPPSRTRARKMHSLHQSLFHSLNRYSSHKDGSVPVYQSTSDSSLLDPRPFTVLPENEHGAVELSDLIGKLNGCSWFFIVLLLLLLCGPLLSQGAQGAPPTSRANGFTVHIRIRTPSATPLPSF